MNSKGRRKSFWKWKFWSSPFSRNFRDSCLRESTANIDTFCDSLQPTTLKWAPKTCKQIEKMRNFMQVTRLLRRMLVFWCMYPRTSLCLGSDIPARFSTIQVEFSPCCSSWFQLVCSGKSAAGIDFGWWLISRLWTPLEKTEDESFQYILNWWASLTLLGYISTTLFLSSKGR